jgi:hypothetical protein
VVVTAPNWVVPAAPIRVKPTTRIVGNVEVTGAPSMLAVIVRVVPRLTPAKSAEYVPF